MITQVELENFAQLSGRLKWTNLSTINLVIGGNGSGKTTLLKAMYVALRTLEEYRRGESNRTAREELADRLYWTFQVAKIGDLVTKGSDGHLRFGMRLDQNQFEYSFGKDTSKQIASLENHVPPRVARSVFLPATEVLSRHDIIISSRMDNRFGFDDTYYDLAKALMLAPRQGRSGERIASARKDLEQLLGGKMHYTPTGNKWEFKKGNSVFPIGVTAEGVKKISILDTLLGNGYLGPDSVVFMDEPEAALHPKALTTFLDIVDSLAQPGSQPGMQFFMASHSYMVIKKLYLIAQKRQISIPLLANEDGVWQQYDLLDGLPENSIIDESINLYEQEVDILVS